MSKIFFVFIASKIVIMITTKNYLIERKILKIIDFYYKAAIRI